jgi:pimeloyl-ACP methyl ester carboxylesterase
MTMRVGPLRAEVTGPESERYTASLLLVHGLWARAPVWRRFAGYLAHRGWRCIALERRAEISDIAAHAADLRAAIAALDAPPVIIGHDLGALLALYCADAARAVVAVAPLVGPPVAPPVPALQHAGTWLARRRRMPLRAPRGRWRDAYPERDVVEPAALVRQLLSDVPSLGAASSDAPPCALFATRDDEITSATTAQALAREVGAEFHAIPVVGHAVLVAPGWEECVAAAHRWIIQRLGVDLLALYEESMRPD